MSQNSSSPSVIALIPARYQSTRLPGKPLAMAAGKPMIQHVYERAAAMRCLRRVIVATDDARIAEAVRGFGGEVVMTRRDHPTGTDRLAEAAQALTEDIVVNIQGDEPLIEEVAVQCVLKPLLDEPDAPMSSIRVELQDDHDLRNPNVVKVVTDLQDTALYFTRSPIPWNASTGERPGTHSWWKHVGLYAYRRDFLLEFVRLERTPLEEREQLEQLRALEHGYRIKVPLCPVDSLGVDTPEDLAQFRRLLENAVS